MDHNNSIEALANELAAANAELEAARNRANDLSKRLRAAKLAATGLAGHLVEYSNEKGWGAKRKTVTERFVVKGFGRWGDRYLAGPMVKQDGTLGFLEKYNLQERLTDLGPYVEPSK